MIWLTWRQFRTQALIAFVVLVAAAIYLLKTGLEMRHSYSADLSSCTPLNDCDDVFSQLQGSYHGTLNLTQFLVTVAPALIGIFWGAPLIGHELESGTHQLAWNQSVMRTRWLAVKLAGVGLASIATAGILSLLLTWWAGPLDQINGNRFGSSTFSTRDIVPIAYAAFAFTLGTTLGLLMRRSIPAMATTLAVFIGIQILVPTTIRPNLLPSTTVTIPINATTTIHADGISTKISDNGATWIGGLVNVPQGAWVLSTTPVEYSSGKYATRSTVENCFPAPDTTPGKPNFEEFGSCLASYDLHEDVTYQPANHYWLLQWCETGIFFVLAGALSGTCFWLIRRRRN